MRECTVCHTSLPWTEEHFYKSTRSKTGLREQCKNCVKEYNSTKGWENHLRRKYNVGPEWYHEQFEAQGGVCYICGLASDVKLHIDHDHKTGELRKLLCSNCNRAIGYAQEDPTILQKMVEYCTFGTKSAVL